MMRTSHDSTQAVVVTGSSSGIGAACVAELDRRGFRVFAGVRSETDGRRLQSQGSERLVPLQLDITDPAAVAEAVRTGQSTGGVPGLAGLVNNAGIAVCGPLEVMPLDELRRQLEVNVVGQVAVTQAFLPLLRAGRGRIVNIGSVNGRLAPPYFGPYAASKFAMEALTDVLRMELFPAGVAVSIVEPASVVTPIWEKSVAATEQLAQRLSEGPTGPTFDQYRDELAAVRQATERFCSAAVPMKKVVRAVIHALCARRPRTRYKVGRDAWLAVFAARWVPDRIRDRFVRRALGLG